LHADKTHFGKTAVGIRDILVKLDQIKKDEAQRKSAQIILARELKTKRVARDSAKTSFAKKREKPSIMDEIDIQIPDKFTFKEHGVYDFDQFLKLFDWTISNRTVSIDLT
jgi:hypothetical protein